MMCHVGESRADAFYDKLKALVAPGGVVPARTASRRCGSRRGSDPFVEKHVFPGYWFFSLEGETKRAVDRGFNVLDVENLRRHYAMTAHHWRRNFTCNYDVIKKRMGFDDRFMRTWEFYLAIVAGSFRAGYLNLIQMTMSNGVNDEYPLTREFLYERDGRPPLATIRHDDGLGALDEDQRAVSNHRHTSRGREPFLDDAHVGAIAIDGQFGETSLSFRLDQRLWSHGAQAIRPSQRHRQLNRDHRAGAAVRVHRNTKQQTSEERVHVDRSVSQDGNPVDTGQPLIRRYPQVELLRAGLEPMDAIRE